jgi:hypothetical protein
MDGGPLFTMYSAGQCWGCMLDFIHSGLHSLGAVAKCGRSAHLNKRNNNNSRGVTGCLAQRWAESRFRWLEKN